MIRFALVLYVVFLVVAFGWRAWVQYRRTGDHGFRGFSRNASPVALAAGLAFTASLFALLGAPVATLVGALRCLALPTWLSGLGVVLAVAGFGLVLVAQLEMGSSWRVGVDPSERTELVTGGLFSVVRNPIFSAMGAFGVGFALLVPNALAALGLIVGLVGLEIHTRYVEEPFLLCTHGDAYGGYARRVGRFLPGVGRLRQG